MYRPADTSSTPYRPSSAVRAANSMRSVRESNAIRTRAIRIGWPVAASVTRPRMVAVFGSPLSGAAI
jgi:hypothetical protein